MGANFLLLPREIRDIIYFHALYPTGTLTLKLHNSRVILQPSHVHSGVVTSIGSPINPLIVLACRQVHAETAGLLWSRNEIYFPNSKRLVDGLRALGQLASRQVQHVRLMVQFEREVRKALAKLASRGRNGDLKSVKLVLPGFDQSASVSNPVIRGARYDDFLNALREMCEAGVAFEKSIEVKSFFLWRGKDDHRSTGLRERHRLLGEQALYELHCAWAGKLICNGTLIFEDYNWADGIKRSPPRLYSKDGR